MKEFTDDPSWTDAQHAYYHALHILKNNPDSDDIEEVIDLLELIGEPKN